MIRFFADKLKDDLPNSRLMAIKAVREARQILGSIDSTLVLG